MARPPVNSADDEGTVRIVVHLVGRRHRPVRGNRMRVFTIRGARVMATADVIARALKKGGEK